MRDRNPLIPENSGKAEAVTISKPAVDQATDGGHAGGVMFAMMTIHLRNSFKATSETNRMFDYNAPTSKSLVEGYIFGWMGLAPQFTTTDLYSEY